MKNKHNSNNEWKEEFVQRLINFSASIIKLTNNLPKTPAGFAIAGQIVRSATSIGANFTEAQDASSAKDFTHKLSISLREAQETSYWLKVVTSAELLSLEIINSILQESSEICAILSSSVKSSKLKE